MNNDPNATKGMKDAFKKPADEDEEDPKSSFWDKLLGMVPKPPSLGKKTDKAIDNLYDDDK